MDDNLSLFVQPDESALQRFARTWKEPIDTGVFFFGSFHVGHIIELAGESGSGKSAVLLQIAASTILPPTFQNCPLGGLAESVVLLDLDQKFDVLRLIEMLNARLQSVILPRTSNDQEAEVDRILQQCLQRFHLIRYSNSLEVLASLKTLRPFLLKLKEQGLSFLLVDNIAAFHWLDAAAKVPDQAAGLSLQAVHAALATELRLVAQQLRLAVVVTKHAFRGMVDWEDKEVMSKVWVDAVSRRVSLRRLGGGVGSLPAKYAAVLHPDPCVHTFYITPPGLKPTF